MLERASCHFRRRAPLLHEWASQFRYRHTRPRALAETAEDVLLRQFVDFQIPGRYVDVGAAHPVVGSVTFAAYRAGWSGVAADPGPGLERLWAKFRPRDHFHPHAVGAEAAEVTFHEFDNPLLSTATEDVAAAHVSTGRRATQRIVEQVTLRELLPAQIEPSDNFFLSIDIEGGEAAALGAVDFNRQRPRVILAESWELPWRESALSSLLRRSDYQLVCYSGLTAFWVPAEAEIRGRRGLLAQHQAEA